MTSLSPYISACYQCRLCKGAAYQMPPFLYAGSGKPDVLVIAQNPGEISSDDAWRLSLFDYAHLIKDPTSIKTLYDIDFITSSGHSKMAKIFGDDWLVNGNFMYTNAVRCRTPHNDSPSEEMVINCMGWTSQLPIPAVVVLMGKIAAHQFGNMLDKPAPPPWKIVKLSYRGSESRVMSIPHYVAMKGKDDYEKAKDLFDEAREMAGLTW